MVHLSERVLSPRSGLLRRCLSECSEAEKWRMYARLLYDFEVECREQGWGDPAFIYDEEKDLFRWTDGRFAFSKRSYAIMQTGRCSGRLGE